MTFLKKLWLFKRKNPYESQIETEIQDMKLYLENNYKDLAIDARKKAVRLLESFYEAGQMNETSYEAYKKILDHYSQEMAHYNHQEFYHS